MTLSKKILSCFFVIFTYIAVSSPFITSSEAGLLDSAKKTAKKASKKAKKTAKKASKKAKKTAKKASKTAKKTAKKATKTIGKTMKKGMNMAKSLSVNPVTCVKSGIKIATMISDIASKSTFPKGFCPTFKKFYSGGCMKISAVISKLGSKAKPIKSISKYISNNVCNCISSTASLAQRVKGADFSKELCTDFKKVHNCCQKLLTFPPAKQICEKLNKTIGKKADKICKKVAGTCPALVASTGVAVTEIVASVAAMVATTEAGPETYIPQIMNIIDMTRRICLNVTDMNKKHCCKMLGPANKACSPVNKFGSGICKQLDCPLQIIQLIKSPSCSSYQTLMHSNCCGRIKKLPLGFGKAFAPLCKFAQDAVKQTVGSACNAIDDGESNEENADSSRNHSRKGRR